MANPQNLLFIFIGLLLLGPVLIYFGNQQERTGKEPPVLAQTGYLALVVGLFGLLAQYMSFGTVLLVFVLLTGAVALVEKFALSKNRNASDIAPDWVEYARGFFPVILAVFLLRSFLVEPFQIPSSSMRPGLVVGDFILVNKFAYGLRMPVTNEVFFEVGKPDHGDVMVFNYPDDPSKNFIKRVIGLPGDKVEYRNKQLSINGKPLVVSADGTYDYVENKVNMIHTSQFAETNGKRTYKTIAIDQAPPVFLSRVENFKYRENCEYNESGFSCKVPQGHFMMMGDNRDNSHDGRYWGFVPENYIVGKAFFIWMSLSDLSRVGTTIQ